MREIEAICVSRDINDLGHEYASRDYIVRTNKEVKDFACQCKIDIICTCKRIKLKEKYFNTSRQVYRSHRYTARDFRDVGVGSIKTVYRKSIKRNYLPETEEIGVGSSDFSFAQRARSYKGGNYYQKKKSSKCVGGALEYINISVVSKKLSPIVKKMSGSTSPKPTSLDGTAVDFNTEVDKRSREYIQNDNEQEINYLRNNNSPMNEVLTDNTKEIATTAIITNLGDGTTFSSDSLIQHVYNLENPSNERVKTSTDFIENKIEREYRKIFTTNMRDSNINSKVKPLPELKSASILRRRFEALRKGLNKKDKQEIKPEVTIKISSKLSVASRRDVSIASDPPSLESRSYSNTKIYTPMASVSNPRDGPVYQSSYEKPFADEKEELSNWPEDTVDSNCQDVKDMFKLWGKKFNLEEDDNKASKKPKKKVEITLPGKKSNKKEKGRRFLFFRKKDKNKSKQLYKQKQGVTAGRCELGDGLTIKIGAANNYAPEVPIEKTDNFSRDYDISGKDWLERFLSKRIDSRNSVRVRWNNSMYATSSSTVFELMDCVYKNTGVIFSSKSEVTTRESSTYYSYIYPQVNFMQQNIPAWMIPKIITDKQINTSINELRTKKIRNNNIGNTLSNQKWFIEKSKTFSQNVEFVLHSTIAKPESSEYIVIDIPKGYFSETCSDDKNNQSSDEQVYNIVEYETLNSNSCLNKIKLENNIESGDHTSKDIQVTISVRDDKKNEVKIFDNNDERQEIHCNKKDSDGYTTKPRDIISVRIITQRDIRDIKKPILKIDNHVESVSTLPPPKKCEFAESFLQDYYRNLTHLGVDLLSWCDSSDKLHVSSSNSLSFKNQGDGSKSCTNIYDQGSTIVSPCETSSCSHCKVEEEKKADDSKTAKFFNKLIKKNVDPTIFESRKRASPKDSYEVYKRRKLYAASNKSKWGVNDDRSEPCSFPERVKQNNSNDRPKVEQSKSYIKQNPQKKCKKHVQLQDCEVMNKILKEQLSDKMVEGILSFKGVGGCDSCKPKTAQLKQTQLIPEPVSEIPQPPCKESCEKVTKPACFKKNSPTCIVPTPPPCPVGSPSPCQKPCPPSPPPCRMSSPCAKPPNLNSSTQCDSQPKPIPPPIHSPKLTSPKRSRTCLCPKKKSSSNVPKCQISKKTLCASTSPHSTSISPSKCRSNSPRKSPCNSCEKCKKSSSHDFPWPLKNQECNTPSPKASGLSLKMSAQLCPQKSSSKCLNAFKRLIKKISNSSLGQKECKPDCANRRKAVSRPCPPAPPPTMISPPKPANCNMGRSTMPGLHLKKLPMPKTCSKDCLSGEESHGVIRLNSREKITIKVKQSTPSTEEIREGCNIKVQDEDGQTLYERRDYRKIDRNKMHFVKDIYRDPRVQRISTTDTHNADIVVDKNSLEISGFKSDTSMSNIIEINLNLKFRQGDKTTEINMNKSVDSVTRRLETSDAQQKSKEIYMLQDKTKTANDEDKRDVNINIVINNYKAPTKLITHKQSVSLPAPDEFSKKISEKFNTVSTGYSDIIQEEKQTYSIHRTTVDLTNSSDFSKVEDKPFTEPEKEVIDADTKDDIICRSEKPVLENRNSSYIIKKEIGSQDILTSNPISEVKVNTSIEKTEASNDDESAISVSITNTDENMNSDSTNIGDNSKLRYRKFNKEEKKKILFKIFETASEIKRRNKNEMQEIRHLLRAVLTSDSSDKNFEINGSLNEELTYTSLKSSLFKDSNSITNYYIDKSYISKVSSKDDSEEVIYPTKDNVSEFSSSAGTVAVQENTGCLCSHLAEKLNIIPNFNPCCCGRAAKIDEEINCDIHEINKNMEVETQFSEVINKFDSITTKNDTVVKALENTSKRILRTENYTSVCHFNSQRQSVLEYSEDHKKDVTDSNFESDTKNDLNKNLVNIKSADVLQFNETKKAVLEIYAEKVISNHGNRVIARLPKFICEKESNIYNYP